MNDIHKLIACFWTLSHSFIVLSDHSFAEIIEEDFVKFDINHMTIWIAHCSAMVNLDENEFEE